MKTGIDPRTPVKLILLAPISVVGGIATWTQYLLNHYDKEKIELFVIDNGKRYEAIGKESNFRGTIFGILNSFALLFQIIFVTAVKRPKLVYLTCSGSWSFFTRDLLFVIVAKCMGLKTLVHLRGGNITSFFGRSPLSRWLSRQIMRHTEKIILVSREMENHSRQLNPQKTVYLPNMIDLKALEKFTSQNYVRADGGMRALHMAWQSPAKGSYDIIEACARIQDLVPGFTCDLVGKAAPEHEAVMLRMIRDKGQQETVRLRSETTGDVKWVYFKESDIFLFPSHSEGFPNAILEAMAFGIPIIASNVGNISEMVGGNTEAAAALILERVNPIDPQELANLIVRLVHDPQLRVRLGANGKKRVRENYSVDIVVSKIEELIVNTAYEP